MSRRDFTLLVAIAAMFGASFLFIRVAAPVTGPLPVAAGRVALGALVPLALLVWRRQLKDLYARGPRQIRDLLVVGALLAALPFTLFAVAELRVTASLAAVLNATAPMWGILVAAVWLGQPLTARRLGGAAIGVAGVAAAVGLGPLPRDPATLAAAGACLLAALSYALGSTWTARRLADAPPTVLAAGQQLGGTVLLALPLVVVFAVGPAPAPQEDLPRALAAIGVLGLLGTGFAFVLWFGLLRRAGPVAAVTVTLLAPVFGILWGAVFLSEPLTLGLLAGTAAVLASVTLINGMPKPATRRSAPARARVDQGEVQPDMPESRLNNS